MMMRRRIKPILALVFFAVIGLCLIHLDKKEQTRKALVLEEARASIPKVEVKKNEQKNESQIDDSFILNPIVDVSGWQLPSQMDYDLLSQNISGAIVRVFGGSQITKDNTAAHTTGIDKSFKTHIKEFQKRNIPVAVYAYALGASEKEMREEAKLFYKNASPFKPTFYWIDVEEVTMADMNAGVEAFRSELEKLGAKNIGIYIGTYFMQEQAISVDKFDAIWFPTYGSNSGYYEAAPLTDLDYDLHQYTSNGWLPGFDNALDLNQIAVTKDRKTTYEKLFGQLKPISEED